MSLFSISNMPTQINIASISTLSVNTETANNITVGSNLIGVLGGDFDGSVTTLAAPATTATLESGKYYRVKTAGELKVTLPFVVKSKRGDKIELLYVGGVVEKHKYLTPDGVFSQSSSLTKIQSTETMVLVPTLLNNTLTLEKIVPADPTSGPAQGSTITFLFNGTNWQCTAISARGTAAGSGSNDVSTFGTTP